MNENIKFEKRVYNKADYPKVIDTSFTQLGVKNPIQEFQNQPTIEDFFILYDKLFYNIPEFGDKNSHEYLIKTSSEYIGFKENNDEIIALQNEIAQLRIDLLESQKQSISTQIGTPLQ